MRRIIVLAALSALACVAISAGAAGSASAFCWKVAPGEPSSREFGNGCATHANGGWVRGSTSGKKVTVAGKKYLCVKTESKEGAYTDPGCTNPTVPAEYALVEKPAPPVFRTCVKAAKNAKTKKYEGEFTDSVCSKKASAKEIEEGKTNKYELGEWNEGKKVTFTGKNGVSTLDSYIPEKESEFWTGGTVAGTVTCKNAKSAGEITGPKETTVTVTFASCTSEGKKCTSVQAGEKPGDITTNLLHTILGFNGKGEVVTLVEGGAEGVANQAEFTCEGLAVETNGSLLGVDTGNINTVTSTSTQTFEVNSKGGQEQVFAEVPNESEAVWGPGTGAVHILKSHITPPGVSLPSGEKTTSTLKGEKVEIET